MSLLGRTDNEFGGGDSSDRRNWPRSTSSLVVSFFSPIFLQKQISNKLPFNWVQVQRQMDQLNSTATDIIVNYNTSERDFPNNNNDYFSPNVRSFSGGDESEMSYDDSDIFQNILINNISGGDIPLKFAHKFDAPEYAVFASVLLLSAAVGVFYGCFGNGQKSTEEYLIANRQMSTIPAALSLLCSFISAITILGNPVEIYFYGSSYALIVVAFIPLTLSLAYLYVPVFYNLKLSSAYEYFELRFNRSVRTVVSLVSIFHYIIYMSIVVYGPSLAIGQVTGISTRMSTAVIFSVCIFYSTLGGLKGVIVTDALQALIMTGSLAAIVLKGTVDLGGFQAIWDEASKYQRTEFFNFDLDPRTRHTFWTAIVGGFMQWLPNFAATHSQVQRYLSMSSLTSIRRALFLNLIGFTLIFGLCYWAGLAVFAKYHDCDPIQLRSVTKSDQLVPMFVMDSMGDYPGLPGLFVAGITCASLSSVSTGLNALSAIVTYDYLRHWMPLLSDSSLLQLSKIFCVLFGIISFSFIFIAENIGNILPAAFSIAGIVIGPTLGIFSLGMFFPWANSKGSLLGLMSAFFIMTSLVVGNQIAANEKLLPDQILPGLTTNGCNNFTNNAFNESFNALSSNYSTNLNFEHLENEFLLNVFSISYMWYPALGCFFAMLFGLLFSIMLSNCDSTRGVNPDHLSPPILWFWIRFFPSHSLKWIDIDMDDYPITSGASSSITASSLRSTDFSFRKETICDMKLKRISMLNQSMSTSSSNP